MTEDTKKDLSEIFARYTALCEKADFDSSTRTLAIQGMGKTLESMDELIAQMLTLISLFKCSPLDMDSRKKVLTELSGILSALYIAIITDVLKPALEDVDDLSTFHTRVVVTACRLHSENKLSVREAVNKALDICTSLPEHKEMVEKIKPKLDILIEQISGTSGNNVGGQEAKTPKDDDKLTELKNKVIAKAKEYASNGFSPKLAVSRALHEVIKDPELKQRLQAAFYLDNFG